MNSSGEKSGFSPERKRLYFVCFLLVVATAFAYWNIDKCGYIHFDDLDYVTLNYHIFPGFTKASINWALSSFYAANWHPLTWLSHMLDYQLYGLKPAGHHLTSLVFHILNTLLLFFALRSMTGTMWRSALVAALFGLHPLHVESVAWVSERKDVLCAFFMFITLLCYSSYARLARRNRHKGFYFAALFFFVLGIMSKPMIVTLPFVLLLLDFWPLGRCKLETKPGTTSNDKSRSYRIMPLLWEKIPFFILSIVSCIVTALAQKAGGAMYQMDDFGVLFRLSNSLTSYMEYLGKTFWPAHLSYFYPLVKGLPPAPWKVLVASALLLLITSIAAIRVRKQPFLLVGWLWFLGMLVPVIGIIQVGSQAMADRYTYLPLIGLFIMIAWLLHDFVFRSRRLKVAAVSCSCIALVLLTFQTRTQASYWKNDFTLSGHAISVTRYNFLAYSMMGISYYAAGDFDNAFRCYTQSLSLCSTQMAPRLNIGCILLSRGKAREAIDIFKGLAASDSNNTLAYLNCGKAYATLGKNDSALVCFARALAIEPLMPPVLFNLGKLYEVRGDYAKGKDYLLQASRMDPNDAATYLELGNCSFKSNNREEAIRWYEKAISLKPGFAAAHRQLAAALDGCGKHELAQKHIRIADTISEAWKAKVQP